MKIVSTGGTLSTDTYLARKRQARRKRQLFALSSLLVLFVLIVFISRLERFRIADISVTGANVIGVDVVTEFTKDVLGGYYLWLIPRDNALIYPSHELKRALANKFPRFSSVKLSLEGLERLAVSVVEREPFALYCGEATSIEAATCYFLDEGGFIFDFAPAFSDGVYFVYADSVPAENPRGRQFLPAPEFRGLVQFIERLPELGLKPLTIKLSQEYFDVALSRDAHLLFNKQSDLVVIYSNLKTFINSDAIRAQADFLDKVTELDLRTENKVFYKF